MARVTYYSGEVELASVYPIANSRFRAIGGTFSRHNAYDGFRRMAGESGGAVFPVTRKVFFKSNPSRHKCGAKCLHAKGHDCECECGGKNHGRGA